MDIKDKIYNVRNVKIMLDRDIASLLGYETKVLNQVVKRNMDKFDRNNYFQLNNDEYDILRSQFVTSNVTKHGGSRYLPYAFTIDGIKILSIVLKKENVIEKINEILEKIDDKNELILFNNNALNLVNNGNSIQNMIYEIRGQLVMLDSDLARIYECTNGTKTINLAVRRHINKFPERFMFQLTKDEYYSILRFQFETLEFEQGKYTKYLPYVFTEQGVAMLATVLRTKVADEISVKIIDAFVQMRKYISNSLLEQRYINDLVII